jgi:hypothetical protein
MKITAVTGRPTLPSLNQGSVTPDKRASAMAAYSGEAPPTEQYEEEGNSEGPKPTTTPRIQMRTNYSTDRDLDMISESTQDPSGVGSTTSGQAPNPEIAISDANESASGVEEATQPLSPQFAALAKQRRAAQVKEAELTRREQALLERENSLTGPTRADLENQLKSDLLGTLEQVYGQNVYTDLTDRLIERSKGVSPEVVELRNKVSQLENTFTEKLTAQEKQQEQAVLKDIRRNVDKLSFSGDDFALIREQKQQQKVVNLIHKNWQETGEVMDDLEAMQLVENELLQDSLKLARISKVQQGLTPAAPQKLQPGIRTITNANRGNQPMSRRQRALQAFHRQ